MAVDITVLNLLSAELDPVIMEITKSLKQLPQKNRNNNNKCFCEAAVWYHQSNFQRCPRRGKVSTP